MCVKKSNDESALKMLKLLLKDLSNERGATAVEYAIMTSLIAAVIVSAVTLFGLKVRSLFEPLIGAF